MIMLYRNKINGSIVESKAVITGENWELVKKPAEVKKEEPEEPKKKVKKSGR